MKKLIFAPDFFIVRRLFKQITKYIFIPIGTAIGAVFIILLLTRETKQSPLHVQRHKFPADSVFIDLDRTLMAKKGRAIDSVFSQLQTRAGFNGCVLYAEKGRLVFKKAYGYDDFKARKRLTTSSAFQLASVSKMFTAMSIMILKEAGLLDYDDTVTKYIPELPYPGITIRNLLNHRSGLPDYMHFSDTYWNRSKPLTNEDMIRIMAVDQPPRFFSPGNGFDYCNTNYALLASIVERITGKPFDVFVKEKIFQPLGMDHTFIYRLDPDKDIPRHIPVGVEGHHGNWRIPREEYNFYQNGVVGDKGVYSTVEDLFKWDQALYDGYLVSDATLEDAFTPGSPRFSKRRDNYGFGWRLKAGREKTVYHYGWWKGFRSYLIRDIDQEKTIIVLTNTTRPLSSQILYDILDYKKYELGEVCKMPAQSKIKN